MGRRNVVQDILNDLLLEWLQPAECVRLQWTTRRLSEGLGRQCAYLATVRARVTAGLRAVMEHGMLCPCMQGLQPVELFVNGLQRPASEWLQVKWNVSTAARADLNGYARHVHVDQADLLQALNRGAPQDVGDSLHFLRQHTVAMHLYVDAPPHVAREPFGCMAPCRWGGGLTVFLVDMRVEQLDFYVVCCCSRPPFEEDDREEEEDDVASWLFSEDEEEEDLATDRTASASPSSFAREAANIGPFTVSDSDKD